MKIQGLPPIDGAVGNVAEKKQMRSAPVESPAVSDTVELSGEGSAVERVDARYTVSAEFPVRDELIGAVAERISRNAYDEPEIQENVAVSIINSPGGTEPSGGAAESVPERTERVETIRTRADDGYYNRPEVLNAIAERLIGSPGLAGLFGR